MSKKSGLFKFLTGAAVGAGLGLLFAPKEGSQTRKELKAKIDEMIANLKEVDKEEVKETVEAKIEQIKLELADLDKEKVLKIAKSKAKDIADLTDELVDYVVKKGTPVLESAATSIREKAIVVTKDVLKRLEKED